MAYEFEVRELKAELADLRAKLEAAERGRDQNYRNCVRATEHWREFERRVAGLEEDLLARAEKAEAALGEAVGEYKDLSGEASWLLSALHTIRGPADRGPFMDAYRAAAGGYEGLQAIAKFALEQSGLDEPDQEGKDG